MKKVISVFILFLSQYCAFAQHLEWANVITADSTEGSLHSTGYNRPQAFGIDTDNNSYFLGHFENIALNASIKTVNTVVKYGEDGEQLWSKNFDFKISDLVVEKNTCDIYAIAIVDTGNIKIGNDNFIAQSGVSSLILLKADSSFNIKWTRFLCERSTAKGNTSFPAALFQNNNRLFISSSINSFFKFKNYEFKQVAGAGTILSLAKTQNGDANEWAKLFTSDLNGIQFHYFSSPLLNAHEIIKTDHNGNIYIALTPGSNNNGLDTNYKEVFTIDSIDITNKGTTIIKINPTGSITETIPIDDAVWALYSIIPSGKLLITGSYNKTFKYKSVSLSSPSHFPSSTTSFLFFLDEARQPVWIIEEENTSNFGKLYLAHSKYSSGNIYLAGLRFDKSKIGGFDVGTNDSLQTLLFCKVDTLGNILWIFSSSLKQQMLPYPGGTYKPSTFLYTFDVDYKGSPIFPASFNGTTYILDTTLIGNFGYNSLLFKLTNYYIKRGNVYAGPYCAGDTIEIPYTKNGKFRADNEFIAQLSDDNGEFLGGERELGRLKSTANGVIKGVLPLFNVNTSGNYRIRILSTHPAVQSYYRHDTLRLLIYSRDSANAGNDTIICRGQSVQLTTTGGSKWDWSPALSLNDSTLFKPTATPETDTRYRIIISDSSGCGDTDTDYVWVRLRQPLDVETPFSDSIACRGQLVKLFATGSGGDSSGYTFSWYERRPVNDVLVGNDVDSITIVSTQNPKTYFAVLNDNCTAKPDTQFYSISPLPPLSLAISGNKLPKPITDTLICIDANLELVALPNGGKTSSYTVNWYDTGFLASGDSVFIPKALPGLYYAVLKDNCTATPDTAFITVTHRLPLSLTINANDSVCRQNPLQLQAVISGGDSTQYHTHWSVTGSNWTSDLNPATHSPSTVATYFVTVSDNCSPSINDSFSITVLPLPTAQFTFDSIYGCPPLNVGYIDKSKGNIGTKNKWIIDNDIATISPNATKLFSKTATTTAKLVTTNLFGCLDSITKTEQIHVFKKPQASFVVTPAILEAEEKASYHSTSTETVKYQWDLGNGQLQYSNGDTSTTYADTGYKTIILVAENTLGCKDTAYKNIRIYDKIHCTIPSGFTPNGDGLNNTFSPVCVGIANYTLTIYNRWGQVIYQKENGAWDGTYADAPAPEGVYMYKIHLHAQSHKKSMVYGTINLIR